MKMIFKLFIFEKGYLAIPDLNPVAEESNGGTNTQKVGCVA
jgi:hypothetical protein